MGLGALQRIRFAIAENLIRTAPRTEMNGIVVADLINDGRSEALFTSLRAALSLLATRDPARYRRIVSDIRRVVFLESGPEFWSRSRTCVLNDITHLPAEKVATTLVHEGTHARLFNLGIEYTELNSMRVERLCVAQELAFLERVPNASALIRETRAKLDQPWWTRDARIDRAVDSLKDARAPKGLVQGYEKLVRFLSRHDRT